MAIGVSARLLLIRAKRLSERPPVADSERMKHLEEAIDAIAIEIERISEAQRFQTKLLADREKERA
ncbi:MAG: hypothetical protein ACJ796_03085 [Gemmatimonadaceae bacterium]